MGDTSERSKPPSLPPRCPCGFWGSSKTMNLCSKCFAGGKHGCRTTTEKTEMNKLKHQCTGHNRDHNNDNNITDIQKKQPEEDCTSNPIQSTGSSQSPVFSSETSSSSSQSLLSSPPTSSEQLSTEEPSPTFPSTREGCFGGRSLRFTHAKEAQP